MHPGLVPTGDGWSEGEPDWDLEQRIAAVNEGDLRFLSAAAVANAHVHRNRIRIRATSLRTGWIELQQCHERLDPVPATQILFKRGGIRGLRVQRAEGIGRAWVEGHSVQLEDVRPGARLCIAAETRALIDQGEGRYRLQNGPYMRRFLDGYYPMRVVLDVQYPAGLLDFEAAHPAAHPGLEVRAEPGHLTVDAAFEGRLFTCMDFRLSGGVPVDRCDREPRPPCPGEPDPDRRD